MPFRDFLIKQPEDEPGKPGPAILIGLFVAFGGILYGYDTGSINGILEMPYFKEHFSTDYKDAAGNPAISSQQTSLVVAILSIGTILGALVASPLADKTGRRWGLIYSCQVFSFGVALQVASSEMKLLIAGRFWAGFGVGLVSAIVPLYQSETAPKWIRGTIVGAYQWAITFGIFLAACANHGTHLRPDSGSYRIPLAIQFLWAIILSAGMLCLPETPRYLIKCGERDEALFALSWLRRLSLKDEHLVNELEEIEANHKYEMRLGECSYIDCFRNGMWKRLFTGCVLQALQQLTGINFIFYYGTYFFRRAGIQNAFTVTLITNIVNITTTVPGLWLVEKLGRRNLLLGGAVGMFVADMIVGIVGATVNSEISNKVLIAFVCVFITFFAASWGPVAWVVTGEIFPLKIRAKALSMTTASNWLLNFALSYCTPYLVDSGPGNLNLGSYVFFIWGGFNFIAIIFVTCCIYETKGLSLEEVDEMYHKVKYAWRSKGFRPVGYREEDDGEEIEDVDTPAEPNSEIASDTALDIAEEEEEAGEGGEEGEEGEGPKGIEMVELPVRALASSSTGATAATRS